MFMDNLSCEGRVIVKRIPWIVIMAAISVARGFAQPAVPPDIDALPFLKEGRLLQISSYDRTGGNSDFIAIQDGATARLADITGPGVIVRIWVTIASPDKHFLRRILLRMFWDGETTPSVEVPIGDFFGTGFQYKQYVTPYLGMSSGGYYSFFPMPFKTSARVEVVNETGQEINSFYYHIDYRKLEKPLPAGAAQFHAQWRRDTRAGRDANYTVLEATGRGHLVGVNMNMQSYGNGMQYLEGDEMVYVDGEKEPSITGTGTEDYFTSGWYFNRGEYAAPYHGLILKDDSLSRIAAYRFHIQDAIPFARSLRFTIEHGHGNEEVADYSSTAYWYQLEPHKAFPPMPPAGFRIPLRVAVPNGAIEAESLTVTGKGLTVKTADMTRYGADWSGNRQLSVEGAETGSKFSVSVPVSEDRYDLSVYYTMGPGYGNVDVSAGGVVAGSFKGYAEDVVPGGRVVLKDLSATNGVIPLDFTVVGKDAKATGFAVGLDAIVAEPNRRYIPEWYVIGPFPNVRNDSLQRLGLDTPYGPEREIRLDATYEGVNGQRVSWAQKQTPPKGRFDLYDFDPYEMVVVYALTYVYSPRAATVPLLLGSDDGVKVFLNGKEIHRFLAVRVAAPDQDRISLTLKEGWNALLLKIENNYGGYNFYARVIDREKQLVFSATQKR
jgi:hypothetical protein